MRILTSVICVFAAATASAQTFVHVDEAIDLARKNNPGLQAMEHETSAAQALRRSSFDLPKASVLLLYGKYNSYRTDNNITVSQTIPFTAFGSNAALHQSQLEATQLRKLATGNDLAYEVSRAFQTLAFLKARRQLLREQDSVYGGFLRAASLRYKTGETNLLEQATAQTQQSEISNMVAQNESDIQMARLQLKTLVNAEGLPDIADSTLREMTPLSTVDTAAINTNPALGLALQNADVAMRLKRLEIARSMPDIQVGFFNQTLIDVPQFETGRLATSADRFTGLQLGISLPLWFPSHVARVKSAEFSRQASASQYEHEKNLLSGRLAQAMQSYRKAAKSIAYYQESALPNASLILRQAQTSFRAGEIGYAEYLLGVRSAMSIREGYLVAVHEFNQSQILIQYLIGNKQ